MVNIPKILLRSGPCWDSPAWLRVYLAGLKHPVTRFLLLALRFKFSPAVLDNIRISDLPLKEKAALFSRAMNLFRAGTAFKTTASARSPLTDAALLARARPGELIVETGVSDGASALSLLEKAGEAEVLLTDLQASFQYSRGLFWTVFYGTEGDFISIKLPLFYLCTGLKSGPRVKDGHEVSLLNPLISHNYPGVRLAAFDIHPSAPLWGAGEPRSRGEALAAETAALDGDDAQRLRRGLESAGLKQERRATRLRPGGLAWDWLDDGTLELGFELPPGAYATSVLAELGPVANAVADRSSE